MWVTAPYRPNGKDVFNGSNGLVRPQTIGQSAKMIIRPAVLCNGFY